MREEMENCKKQMAKMQGKIDVLEHQSNKVVYDLTNNMDGFAEESTFRASNNNHQASVKNQK
jgi:hypothetical protein